MREQDDQLYIYELYGIKLPRLQRATKELRAKIGTGTTITKQQIEKAEEALERSGLQFEPLAMHYMESLEKAVFHMKEHPYNRDQDYDQISLPIMQIKGQAGMFGNNLASEVSLIILEFLEKYRRLDDNVLDIITIYIKVIRLSYKFKLSNMETPGAHEIITELSQALDRYKQRFEEKIKG